MQPHWLIEHLTNWGERDALVYQNEPLSYTGLRALIDYWAERLRYSQIYPGQSLAICGDYSPQACALILAALANGNIVVPLSSLPEAQWDEMMEIARVQHAVAVDQKGTYRKRTFERSLDHPLLC